MNRCGPGWRGRANNINVTEPKGSKIRHGYRGDLLCPCFWVVQSERRRKTEHNEQRGGCGPNVVEKPTTLRRMVLCVGNVIEKPTTLRRVVVCVPNVTEKPTTL